MNAIRLICAWFHNFSKPAATQPAAKYIRASDLPCEPERLLDTGIISEWRTDATGEPWFRVDRQNVAEFETLQAAGFDAEDGGDEDQDLDND